jgi:hypothetical protein
MAENFDIFGFDLDASDMEAIATLETGRYAYFRRIERNFCRAKILTPCQSPSPLSGVQTTRDLPSIGRLGSLLIKEHHNFDSRRFIAASSGTPAGYASFIETQLEDPDKAGPRRR